MLRTDNACQTCGLPTPAGQTCGRCVNDPPAFDSLLSACLYRFPLSAIIQQYKFKARLEYAYPLSQLLVDVLRQQAGSLPQCILPVPLHKTRQRRRGFNQAIELARPIAKQLGIRLDYTSCLRHKNTRQQASLSLAERSTNLNDAFSVRPGLRYRHVAILDDIVTSTNTVNALARMLRRHGVETIEAWCIARAV